MSRKIGALWARKTQDGKSYLSGVIQDIGGDIQIVVFRNDRKEKENQPDFSILLSEKKQERKVEGSGFDGLIEPTEKINGSEEMPIINADGKGGYSTDNAEDDIGVERIPF